jgi:hypothetical protein
LDNPDPSADWELTLEEAIHMALKNSKVIRTLSGVGFSQGGVSGSPSMLLQSPGGVRTVYDPALVESDPRYGQEAALAAFDAQFNASTSWDQNYTPNSRSDSGSPATSVGASKYTATGTQFQVRQDNRYNYQAQDYGPPYGVQSTSSWTSQGIVGFSHPLLRGSGVEFNRISGPGSNMPGMYAGVAVARINTDMSLNDFEMATRSLVVDVEKA